MRCGHNSQAWTVRRKSKKVLKTLPHYWPNQILFTCIICNFLVHAIPTHQRRRNLSRQEGSLHPWHPNRCPFLLILAWFSPQISEFGLVIGHLCVTSMHAALAASHKSHVIWRGSFKKKKKLSGEKKPFKIKTNPKLFLHPKTFFFWADRSWIKRRMWSAII